RRATGTPLSGWAGPRSRPAGRERRRAGPRGPGSPNSQRALRLRIEEVQSPLRHIEADRVSWPGWMIGLEARHEGRLADPAMGEGLEPHGLEHIDAQLDGPIGLRRYVVGTHAGEHLALGRTVVPNPQPRGVHRAVLRRGAH